MAVRLISYSKASEFQAYPDGQPLNCQDLIAYCARVSNPSNQMNTETSAKLIKYLVKHAHWSPLEMVNACLEIETTRDIAHQIVRHRSFSFQEFSQRYANPEDMADTFQTREARLQDEKNRQNSIETNDGDLKFEWLKQQSEVALAVRNAYAWALENGIAKEQARAVLPEGITESKMYMNGTLRSWMHYIELRSGVETQKEHREIAIECGKVLQKIFPLMKKITSD